MRAEASLDTLPLRSRKVREAGLSGILTGSREVKIPDCISAGSAAGVDTVSGNAETWDRSLYVGANERRRRVI